MHFCTPEGLNIGGGGGFVVCVGVNHVIGMLSGTNGNNVPTIGKERQINLQETFCLSKHISINKNNNK